MYAMKKQYEYARHDETGHSHFTRVVKKGAKKGTKTGCKHRACNNNGTLPLPPCLASTELYHEILCSLLLTTFHLFPRTSSTWAESPVSTRNLQNASRPQLKRRLWRSHALGPLNDAIIQLRVLALILFNIVFKIDISCCYSNVCSTNSCVPLLSFQFSVGCHSLELVHLLADRKKIEKITQYGPIW